MGYGSAKLKHILNKACRHRGAALVQGELGGGGRAGVVGTEPSLLCVVRERPPRTLSVLGRMKVEPSKRFQVTKKGVR